VLAETCLSFRVKCLLFFGICHQSPVTSTSPVSYNMKTLSEIHELLHAERHISNLKEEVWKVNLLTSQRWFCALCFSVLLCASFTVYSPALALPCSSVVWDTPGVEYLSGKEGATTRMCMKSTVKFCWNNHLLSFPNRMCVLNLTLLQLFSVSNSHTEHR
jgi:hypothetical protein